MELIVGAAFGKTSISTSTGPEILIFKRFKNNWLFVDQDNFQTASTDASVETLVSPFCVDITEFAQKYLEAKQVRDDYREFLEISIIFLGGIPWRDSFSGFQVPCIHSGTLDGKSDLFLQDVTVPCPIEDDSFRRKEFVISPPSLY